MYSVKYMNSLFFRNGCLVACYVLFASQPHSGRPRLMREEVILTSILTNRKRCTIVSLNVSSNHSAGGRICLNVVGEKKVLASRVLSLSTGDW